MDKNDIKYSNVVRAGKRRTYFFDVRKTKGDDYFVTITESTKRYDGDGYERHKVLLYKEDFNRFLSSLQDTVDYIKNDLLPEYDYEEFDRRQEEWENKKEEEESQASTEATSSSESPPSSEPEPSEIESSDDLSW